MTPSSATNAVAIAPMPRTAGSNAPNCRTNSEPAAYATTASIAASAVRAQAPGTFIASASTTIAAATVPAACRCGALTSSDAAVAASVMTSKGAEQRPRRHGPADVLCDVKEEQVDRPDRDRGPGGSPRRLSSVAADAAWRAAHACPANMTIVRPTRTSSDGQDADGCAGVPPPHRQDDPRQQSAGHRQNRRPSSGALDEQTGIENGQEQREAPERAAGARAGREEQQHGEACEEHRAGAPRGSITRPRRRQASGTRDRTRRRPRTGRHRGPQARRT